MADLMYSVLYTDFGHFIFDKVEIDEDTRINFIRETGESRYTLNVDLYFLLDEMILPSEFDTIKYLLGDEYDEVSETVMREAESEYSREYIEEVMFYKGDYEQYLYDIGKIIMDDPDVYEDSLYGSQVYVETWL